MTFTKESTHYYIISNIWIATSVLSERAYVVLFAGALGLLWFLYALLVSHKEKAENEG